MIKAWKQGLVLGRKQFATAAQLEAKLRDSMQLSALKVLDVSGGCGSSFQVEIESSEFKGLSLVQQHQLVNKLLKAEMKEIHALTLKTTVPKE